MKSLLITGGAGFIGSNLVEYLIEKYPDYQIVVLDLLTYAGNAEHLKSVKNAKNFTFIKGDICDRALVERIFQHHIIKGVFHLAAESHVDNSILRPDVFIETNVKGTFTLLDVAYKYWMEKPFVFKSGLENSRFLQVSTVLVPLHGLILPGGLNPPERMPWSLTWGCCPLILPSRDLP